MGMWPDSAWEIPIYLPPVLLPKIFEGDNGCCDSPRPPCSSEPRSLVCSNKLVVKAGGVKPGLGLGLRSL